MFSVAEIGELEMRTIVAIILTLTTTFAVAQTIEPAQKASEEKLSNQKQERPKTDLSLMLAQAPGSKTYTCKCPDPKDSKKVDETTCTEPKTCSCTNGKASCK